MNRGTEPDEFYSQEAQQIIGKEPAWVVRYGVYVVLSLLLLLFAGSFLIRYSDVASGRVKLQLQPSSYLLQAGCDGQLELLRHHGDSIHRGELIAVVKNDANVDDIYQLKSILAGADSQRFSSGDLPQNLRLGELEEPFEQLKRTLDQHSGLDPMSEQKEQLFDRVHRLKVELLANRNRPDLLLPVTDDWDFLKKNSAFWSSVDERYRLACGRIAKDERELSETLSEMEGQLLTPQLARRYLLDEISAWEKKYVLTAPADGRIFFLCDKSGNGRVKEGQPLFRIDAGTGIYTVVAQVPARDISRLEIGQESRIRLDRYPAAAYGMLHAKVDSIGVREGGDTVDLRLRLKDEMKIAKGVKTKTGELTGKVEVVLEKRSLFVRLFKNINMFF